MKLKNLFLAGLALVCMTACSNDDDPQATPNENVNAYMQINIVGTDGNVSRAGAGNNTTLTAGKDESTIKNMKVILCDKDNKVKYVYDVKGLTNTTGTGVITDPIATVAGDYKVYVIANCPKKFPLIKTPQEEEEGTDMSTVLTIEGITEKLMKAQYAANETFIMFNESLGKETSTYSVAPTIKILPTNLIGNPAQLEDPIKLDRLAAKIVKSSEQGKINIEELNKKDITGLAEAHFESVTLKGFKLINGASKVNLQQQWLFDYPSSLPNLGQRMNTLLTPSLEAHTNFYNPFAGYSQVTYNKKEEKYTAAKDNYPSIKLYGENEDDPIYCMENNPSFNGNAGVQALNENTTGLFFRFQATLKDVSKPGNEAALGANTFYWYNGAYYFTLADIQAKYAKVFEKAKQTSTLSETSNLELAIAELAKAIENNDEAAISTFRTKYMIKVFNQGIMYYPYFITDRSWKQLKNEQTENDADKVDYVPSIMRNTVYSLKVTKLNNIGGDIPGNWNPKLDPNAPINPNDVYMQVEVTVNPWILQSDDITLG